MLRKVWRRRINIRYWHSCFSTVLLSILQDVPSTFCRLDLDSFCLHYQTLLALYNSRGSSARLHSPLSLFLPCPYMFVEPAWVEPNIEGSEIEGIDREQLATCSQVWTSHIVWRLPERIIMHNSKVLTHSHADVFVASFESISWLDLTEITPSASNSLASTTASAAVVSSGFSTDIIESGVDGDLRMVSLSDERISEKLNFISIWFPLPPGWMCSFQLWGRGGKKRDHKRIAKPPVCGWVSNTSQVW